MFQRVTKRNEAVRAILEDGLGGERVGWKVLPLQDSQGLPQDSANRDPYPLPGPCHSRTLPTCI